MTDGCDVSAAPAPTRERILHIAAGLPAAPRIFAALTRLLSVDTPLDDIAELISLDASLSAHIIRVSNSAYHRGELPTGSIGEAVGRVGYREVYRLVGYLAGSSIGERALEHYRIPAARLRENMLQTAFVGEQLAGACGIDPRTAYTAGLMRQLGRFVCDRLAESLGPEAVFDPGVETSDAWERRTVGVTADEAAAMVLKEWHFPAEIVEAIRRQRLPEESGGAHKLASLVHIASAMVARWDGGLPGETHEFRLTRSHLEAAGLTVEAIERAAVTADRVMRDYLGRTSGEELLPGVPRDVSRLEIEGEAEAVVEVVGLEQRSAAGGGAAGANVSLGIDFHSVGYSVSAISMAETGGIGPAIRSGEVEPPRGERSADLPPSAKNCDFVRDKRVVGENDDNTVHTPDAESAVKTPTDFTTFMRDYQDMVYSTAARLTGNEAQAEDIAQEVFIKAHAHWDSLRGTPTAGGWLKTVATNMSINHIQRYKKRWSFFSDLVHRSDEGDEKEVEFAAPDTFFDAMDASERRVRLEEALDKLPAHQRVPLVLFHFEEMPYDEIAKKLRVSLSKVKTDILRGREALAKILVRRGTAHEAFQP